MKKVKKKLIFKKEVVSSLNQLTEIMGGETLTIGTTTADVTFTVGTQEPTPNTGGTGPVGSIVDSLCNCPPPATGGFTCSILNCQ